MNETRFLWLKKLTDSELLAVVNATQLWIDEGNPKRLDISDKQWGEAADASEDILVAASQELEDRNPL